MHEVANVCRCQAIQCVASLDCIHIRLRMTFADDRLNGRLCASASPYWLVLNGPGGLCYDVDVFSYESNPFRTAHFGSTVHLRGVDTLSVTGTGTVLLFYVWFRVSFDTQYVLCLVLSIFDTQYVLCLVLSIVWYVVCFMFGFEYRLILSMFYVWFRVSFDTQYVLCLVSSYRWILDLFYVTFQGWPLRQPYGYCLQGSG